MKQGEALKGLRSAHAALVKEKARLKAEGMDPVDAEYEGTAPELKRRLWKFFRAACNIGLDATGILMELNKMLA